MMLRSSDPVLSNLSAIGEQAKRYTYTFYYILRTIMFFVAVHRNTLRSDAVRSEIITIDPLRQQQVRRASRMQRCPYYAAAWPNPAYLALLCWEVYSNDQNEP